VQVPVVGGYDLGYHVVWCPKYRRSVLGGRVAARGEELVCAKTAGQGWPTVALEIMSSHVDVLVKAHRCDSPSRVAGQFKAFTSQRLGADLAYLRSCLPARWSRSYFAAAGVVSAETVGRYSGTQNERPWREERAR
jgi:putative transposase